MSESHRPPKYVALFLDNVWKGQKREVFWPGRSMRKKSERGTEGQSNKNGKEKKPPNFRPSATHEHTYITNKLCIRMPAANAVDNDNNKTAVNSAIYAKLLKQ